MIWELVYTANATTSRVASNKAWEYASSGELLKSWDGTSANVTAYTYTMEGTGATATRATDIKHGGGTNFVLDAIKVHQTKKFVTDLFGRVESQTIDGYGDFFVYDTLDRPTRIYRPEEAREQHWYDVSGASAMDCLSDSSNTQDLPQCNYHTFDSLGRKTSTNHTTILRGSYFEYFTYDNYDRMITSQNDSLTDSDPNKAITLQANPSDRTTYMVYDELGHTLKLLGPVMRSQSKGLTGIQNDVNSVVQVTDLRRSHTEYLYDSFGRQSGKAVRLSGFATPASLGVGSLFGPGNICDTSDAIRATTCSSFDAYDRPISITDPDGFVTGNLYDAMGHLILKDQEVWRFSGVNPTGYAETYANFRKVFTKYAYDASGRTLKTIDPRSNSQDIRYDPLGNPVAFKDQRNVTTKLFRYTSDGLLELVAEPNSQISTPSDWNTLGTTVPA
jgi:YD repeat-containing protein